MKLNSKIIAALEPNGSDFTIWDDQVRGLGIRMRSGGGKSFIVKSRVGSGRSAKQVLVTIGKTNALTLEEARTKARKLLLEAVNGETPMAKIKAESQNDKPNIQSLCELWLEKGSLRSRQKGKLGGSLRDPKNIAIDEGRIRAHILPLLGKVPLEELNRKIIARFRDSVARGDTASLIKTKPHGLRRITGGEGTANRTLRLLSSILSFGVREGLLETNPALGIEKSPDRSLERFLSPDEMKSLGETLILAEAKGVHSSAIAIIRLLALSGARKGEIEKLKWSEVDLKTGFLRLSTSKTGAKLIPITGPMHTILEEQPTNTTNQWVFPDKNASNYYQGTPKFGSKSEPWQALKMYDYMTSDIAPPPLVSLEA